MMRLGLSSGAAPARLLDRLGERLRHVRILGGGPEAALHEGQGVGELMGRLALAGYTGTVILSPGSKLTWRVHVRKNVS
jgi:hypothetical protein